MLPRRFVFWAREKPVRALKHERARIFISDLKLDAHFLANTEHEPDRILIHDGVVDERAPL